VVNGNDGAPLSWNVVREAGKTAATVSKDSAIKHGGRLLRESPLRRPAEPAMTQW